MAAPKKSFFTAPLLVALLVTSVIHAGLIFCWSKIDWSTPEKKTSHHIINLITLPLHKEPEKTEAVKPVPTKVAEIQPPPPLVAAKNSIPNEKTIPALAKKPKLQKRLKVHHSETSAIAPAADSEPLLESPPAVESVSVVEPAPPVAAEVHPAVIEEKPVAPIVNQTVVNDKPVESPVKTSHKPPKAKAEKPSQAQAEAGSASHVSSTLSMDDLALQIAQAGEKFGNLPPTETAEKPVTKPSSAPKTKFLINQYTSDCRQKVERIGNLNYPKSAWEQDYSARVVIEAVVSADGSLQSSRIKKSSGDAATDEAAKNIVQMSAPFPVFPKVLAEQREQLTIRFPLHFSDESGVTAQ